MTRYPRSPNPGAAQHTDHTGPVLPFIAILA
jgi:hypothetical protein